MRRQKTCLEHVLMNTMGENGAITDDSKKRVVGCVIEPVMEHAKSSAVV